LTGKKLKWALRLAKAGIRIIPLHHTYEDGSCSCGKPREGDNRCRSPGKHPVAFQWDKVASNDTQTVRDWFEATPDMNYGVVADDNVYLLDIDSKKGAPGYETAATLLGVEVEDLKNVSFSVETTSGGMHLYFDTDVAYSNTARTALGAGLDSRSGIGYVVGPYSAIHVPIDEEFGEPVCELREYKVLNNPSHFTPLPESIKSKLSMARERSDDAQESVCDAMVDHPTVINRAREILKLRKPAVEGEGGNDHTYVTAEVCRDLNLSEEATLELLMEDDGWNDRCDPPWDYEELKTVVSNAYRYAKSPMGNKGGYLITLADEYGYTFGDEAIDSDSVLPEDYDIDDEFKKKDFVFYDGEIVNTLNLHYDFVIDGWLPAKNYTIVLGERGSGKTTYIMDAVCHIITETPWHGSEVDTDWHVVYVAAEDFPGVKERYEAWCASHPNVCVFNSNTGRWQIKDPSRIQFVEMAIDLLDFQEVNRFALKVQELVRQIRKKQAGKKINVLFVLDTWQRVTSAAVGGQSSDESMQKALNSLEALAGWFKGPCIIAAHPPKNNTNTMSGSLIIENRSDAIWQVGQNMGDSTREIMVSRIKGAPEYVTKNLKIIQKDISGFDKFGKPRRSVTVEYRGGTSVESEGRKVEVSESQQHDDDAYGELLRDLILNVGNFDPEFNSDGGPLTKKQIVVLMSHCFNKKYNSNDVAIRWRGLISKSALDVMELQKAVDKLDNRKGIYQTLPVAAARLDNMLKRHKGEIPAPDGSTISVKQSKGRTELMHLTASKADKDKFMDDIEEQGDEI